MATYLEAVKWYSLQKDLLALRAFRRLLETLQPDAVHFHNFQFLTFALVHEAKKQGAPSCLSIYDYWPFCPKAQLLRPDNTFCAEAHGVRCLDCLPDRFAAVQRPLLARRRRVFDRCFEALDQFHALSEHSAGVLREYGIPGEKIRVVPLTLPFEYGAQEAPPEPGLVEDALLFVGWLNDRKGVHMAIKAMPHILARRPEAKLYVVGGRAKFAEEYEAAYEEFIRSHNLEDRVEFLGHLPPERVRAHIEGAKALLLPEQYENMSPLVMVEAMLLGTPVVASRVGGIPEYIEHGETGFLADPRTPEDFAAHAVHLLENPALRVAIADAARKAIRSRNNTERIWECTRAAYAGLTAKG
jgi:glycosyltransferase involved in cell wall biosynthesis